MKNVNLTSNLQTIAIAEATTSVLLVCVAVPLKHLGGHGQAVSILGPVHGLMFILYIWMVIYTASTGVLKKRDVCRMIIASIIPFGGFVNALWLKRLEEQQ